MSTPTIDYPGDWAVSRAVERVLEKMFHGYARVELRKEFTEGQSSTHVYLIVAHHQNGRAELPGVVKIGPEEVILPEWQAARAHAMRRLPDFVEIEGEPTLLDGQISDGRVVNVRGEHEHSAGGHAGLRYRLAGDGVFDTESLRVFSRTAEAAAFWQLLEGRLFRQMAHIWREHPQREMRAVHASYDRVLPVNLLVEPLPNPSGGDTQAEYTLDAQIMQRERIDFDAVPRGAVVQLRGFVVTEIERAHGMVTLNLPQADEIRRASFRLRVRNVPDLAHGDSPWRLGQMAAPLVGRVLATRHDLLQREVENALGWEVDVSGPTLVLAGQNLPNPLHCWPALLAQAWPMRIGTVHGDLNLGNVLVDVEALTTRVIDCAHTHRGHVLYDLVRLEAEILLHPLALALFRDDHPSTHIVQLYRWLDGVTRSQPHDPGQFSVPRVLRAEMPTLLPAYIALSTIRNAARPYLADAGQWSEYYVALALTLLGSLKFDSLSIIGRGQQPKAIAFWGAAAILAQLERAEKEGWQNGGVEFQAKEWEWLDLRTDAAKGAPGSAQSIDQSKSGIHFEHNEKVHIGGSVVRGETVYMSAPDPGGLRIIHHVLYAPQRYRFFQLRNPASGKLEIEGKSVRFRGPSGTVELEQIHAVEPVRMGGWGNNRWIRVQYVTGGSEGQAYFSHPQQWSMEDPEHEELLQSLQRCASHS